METGAETYSESKETDSAAPTEKSPRQQCQHWTKEMNAAHKRMRQYLRQGNCIVQRFLDERDKETLGPELPFRVNLFHSNVTTVSSMLYGRTPKIDVTREFGDPDDDIARVGGVLLERMLLKEADFTSGETADVLRSALQDRLLPGMGIGRVRYDVEVEEMSSTVVDFETGEEEAVTEEILKDEKVHTDYVHWQDVRWGWCRTWKELPWLAFRSWMDKEECRKRFGDKVCEQLEYKVQTPGGDGKTNDEFNADQRNNVMQAEVWEIWCKEDRTVCWWSPGAQYLLDHRDDPLGLEGFWPCPKPMMANLTTSLFMPKADFTISQDLYNEIDTLQTRIAIITKAIKVVGVYDKSSTAVKRMLNEGVENELIPVDNWAMFAEKGGLKGQIDWFPIQDVVAVLQTLKQIQQDTIQLLYESTGLSDILRGHSNQYAGVGQEEMKAKFASIRVQALQDEFARFASDLEALKAEIISKHFSFETIARHSNAAFIGQFDRDKVGPAIEMLKSPEVQWRINIKPESIAMVDYAQLKAERVEFLTAMATYVQSAGAMLGSVPQALPVLMEMLKFSMSGFKGSDYLEGMLDQAIDMAKQQPLPDPNQQQAQQQQADQQRAQMEHQMEMARIQGKAQADQQLQQQKFEQRVQELQQQHQAKMSEAVAKSQGDMQKIMADLRGDLQIIAAKLNADLATEESQATNAAAEAQVNHENELVEMDTEHEYKMQEMRANASLQTKSSDSGTGADN